MEKNFNEIWNTLTEDYGYERGDIVDYGDIIYACDSNNLPHMSMQDVSNFEKEYGLIIEW